MDEIVFRVLCGKPGELIGKKGSIILIHCLEISIVSCILDMAKYSITHGAIYLFLLCGITPPLNPITFYFFSGQFPVLKTNNERFVVLHLAGSLIVEDKKTGFRCFVGTKSLSPQQCGR